MKKYWLGPAPVACDLCEQPLTKVFTDGKTRMGPWGCMCPACHAFDGAGLGQGKGQRYAKQADGKWLKTGG